MKNIILAMHLTLVLVPATALSYSLYNNGDFSNPIVAQKLSSVTNQTYSVTKDIMNFSLTKSQAEYGLNKEQKGRADQLLSVFENDTTEIQYGYIENIDDGRGFTAGRAGFTSRYDDFYMVVQKYTDRKPSNALAKYLPRLKELVEEDSDSVDGLEGIEKAWTDSAKDKVFRDVQDEVTDELYYDPAMKHAKELGLQLALSKAFLYDTIVQHGDWTDPDGLPSIINKTNSQMGGSPKDGVDEKAWLYKMIQIRKNTLLNPFDKESQEGWSQSIDRCTVYKQIADSGNFDLDRGITVNSPDHQAVIK